MKSSLLVKPPTSSLLGFASCWQLSCSCSPYPWLPRFLTFSDLSFHSNTSSILMAWKTIGEKILQASFKKVVASKTHGSGTFLLPGLPKLIPNFYFKDVHMFPRNCSVLQNCYTTRMFHASYSPAFRMKEQAPGLKVPKKEKRVRRENRSEAPVEAPYIPPRQKLTSKLSPEKTIDIFEGITIVEMAKRTGTSISSLQESCGCWRES